MIQSSFGRLLWTVLILFPVAICLFPAAGLSSTPPFPQSWTAKQAVEYALANSPASTIARKRIDQAQAATALARAADHPTVLLSSSYGYTNNPMHSFGNILNQGEFDNSIDFNDPGATDNLQFKGEVRYRLYNGGQDQADKQAALAGVETSRHNLARVHQQLAFEVVKSFHNIIEAEEMVDVREESVRAISASLAVGRARFEAGDLLLQDLLHLELQQARASESLIHSKHQLELQRRIFLNLLGLHEGEVNLDRATDILQAVPETPDYSGRPELLYLAAMEKRARAERQKAAGESLPSIDLFSNYQVNKGFETGGDGDSWMAGVQVDFTLYDGHRSTAMKAIANTKLQEIKEEIHKTQLALNLELEQTKIDFTQAKQRLAVTAKMVDVAEEAARLSRARFKEGVILASDLIDFEMKLADAQGRHLSAEASYRIAIANLRLAAGLPQFPN